mgnify:CR=1 FL=1
MEIQVPIELQRPSWVIPVGQLPYTINLPPRRGVGTSVVMDTDSGSVLVPHRWTHIQLPIASVLGVPWERMWFNLQALDGNGAVASAEWLINNAYVHPDAIIASEMIENWYNHGMPNRMEEVYQGFFNRMKNQYGVTSPNQTRLYQDYWLFMIGDELTVNWTFMTDADKLREGLASQANARRKADGSNWGSTSSYFSGPVNYRNILIEKYMSNHWNWKEGIPIYNAIYNVEKHNLAFDEYRRMLGFGWVGVEGIQSRPVRQGGASAHIRFPGGRLLRRALPAHPWKTIFQHTFWHLALADDIVFWNVAGRANADPHKFAIPEEGPSHDSGSYGNIRWWPDGGSIQTYNPSNPSHPVNTRGPETGTFPYSPEHAETAAFAGAWMYSQISGVSDRVSFGLRYAPFRYKIGSGSWQSGYHDGNNPMNGSLGNARVSHHGTKNYGQHNVVNSYVAGKPLLMYGTGQAGGCYIFYIPKAPLTETITIEAYANGTKTYTCKGSGTHVFME